MLRIRIEDNSRNFIIDFVIETIAEERREKSILKRSRLAMLHSLIFLILLSSSISLVVTQNIAERRKEKDLK